jgi:RimJ/RimL family protein N-acetyltransferase
MACRSVRDRAPGNGNLLGGTGLAFETATVAATGYVLARDALGNGYATEALAAIVVVARDLGVERLYALVIQIIRRRSTF